ncbi:hypothetical protein SAMD00019534_075680 [Acytostelium subglobosum LB1]|uniref:hypothetical protein n=1 Tax=Acytostelium subglobosum LB1 TaxID=1410327 RepID=UPI00064520EA|nr:hypothetical protein SAMD00019534_075680 [Acytostelium subglobosum LB1]GAM24393.1 hypothetical protein SAMD00019534_075680 [Acytostelium subglobosum LB1]|eukprot:XP_012752719.1 hypothetical protein SAMD00019534_075680 [Acytostelium subglobosum LB1]
MTYNHNVYQAQLPGPEEDIAVESDDYQKTSHGKVQCTDSILEAEGKFLHFRTLWAFTGPGFLMSIAYLDPGNLESDIQAGAAGGYQLLWVLLWSTIVGLWLQMLASRLGTVTGMHLAEHCRQHYPRTARILLWIMTELAIIGSDIQEVIGTSIAINILSNGHIPLWAGVLITAADTFTFLMLENYGIRKLEAFFCSLIAIMGITFAIEYGISKPDQLKVLEGCIIPMVSKQNVTMAVGILGAVIMPHNIYLHSALVQSRDFDRSDKRQIRIANKYFGIESAIALFISFILNLLVVSLFAVGFQGVDNIGLSSAATFLGEKYGQFAKYIWAVGLLAAGQCSTMTGTYAGQFVMEGFLNLKIRPWKRLLITRCSAIVPAICVAILSQNHLDSLDEWLNVLQSVQLPFAILPVLYFTSRADVMGEEFKNHWLNNIFVRVLSVLIIGINIYLIVQATIQLSTAWWMITILVIGFLFYFAFIIYLALGPRKSAELAQRARALFGVSSVGQDSSYDRLDETSSPITINSTI